MLKHVVFIKFKPEASEADIHDLESSLKKLPEQIAEIQGYEFGRDVIHSERSYDFALVATLADLDALNRYQKHPDHLLVVDKVRKVSATVLAVDFQC